MSTIREILFKGFEGCLNGNCIIKVNKGLVTNGWCSCLQNMTNTQLSILQSRLYIIRDKEIDI